jgi:hypothetical protein
VRPAGALPDDVPDGAEKEKRQLRAEAFGSMRLQHEAMQSMEWAAAGQGKHGRIEEERTV